MCGSLLRMCRSSLHTFTTKQFITLSLTLPLSRSFSLSLCRSLSLFLSLFVSLSCALSLSLFLCLSLSLSLSPYRQEAHVHSGTRQSVARAQQRKSLSLSLIHFLSLSLSLSLCRQVGLVHPGARHSAAERNKASHRARRERGGCQCVCMQFCRPRQRDVCSRCGISQKSICYSICYVG